MNITTELAGMFGVVFAILFGIWFRIESLVNTAVRKVEQRVEIIEIKYESDRKQLIEFQLEVAKKYAPTEYIRDVEGRLMATMTHMNDQMSTMPDRLARIVKETLQLVNGINGNT